MKRERELWKKCLSLPKKYLIWAGFNLEYDKADYLIEIWVDIILATIYTGVSILLMWNEAVDKEDLIVFGLNILCLGRAMINNFINAKEVTETRINLQQRREGNSHYHLNLRAIGTFLFIALITWCILFFEENSSILIRVFASLAMAVVLFNDYENNIVHAYHASIKQTDSDGGI